MAETIRLVVDGAAMAELLRGPTGPLMTWMRGRAEIVQQAAIRDCPKRTGYLSTTIKKRDYLDDVAGPSIIITAFAEYAAPVHEGAAPHDIPNAFGRGSTFGIGGRFAGRFHPGNKANPFLARNLPLFVAV